MLPVAQWIEQWFPVMCGVRFLNRCVCLERSGVPFVYKEEKNLDNFRMVIRKPSAIYLLGNDSVNRGCLFSGIRAFMGGLGRAIPAKDTTDGNSRKTAG